MIIEETLQFIMMSVPEVIDSCNGNMSEAARKLNVNRTTVAKYRFDVAFERHVVLQGKLYSLHKQDKPRVHYTRVSDRSA